MWKPLGLPAGLRQDGLSSSGPASRVQSGLKAGGWVPSSEQVPDSRLWGQPTRPVELSCSGMAGVMELSDHLFLAGWSPPPTPEALGRYWAEAVLLSAPLYTLLPRVSVLFRAPVSLSW